VREVGPGSVALDWGALARGASSGFTVLFIGGWLYPAALKLGPTGEVGYLVAVGLIGFGLAGVRCGQAAAPALHGSIAAVLGYVLMVPVILIAHRETFGGQLGWAVLGALLVGGAAGHISGRLRTGRANARPRNGRSR
jgi:hypothetical protein